MSQLICLLLLLPALAQASQIPFVGVDSDGHQVEKLISKDEYVERMSTLIASVEETTFPLLGQFHSNDNAWQLQTFTLGIALNLTVGIGPIFSVGISPALTFVFSNNKEPIIP